MILEVWVVTNLSDKSPDKGSDMMRATLAAVVTNANLYVSEQWILNWNEEITDKLSKKNRKNSCLLWLHLSLDIPFVGRVNKFVAWDFCRFIEHTITFARFNSRPIFRCIPMTIIEFPIFRWESIVQPWLIEWKLTIIWAKFTFWHFTSKGRKTTIWNYVTFSKLLFLIFTDIPMYSLWSCNLWTSGQP